jgi:hypothetical protein
MTLVWKTHTKVAIGYDENPITGTVTSSFVTYWFCPGKKATTFAAH